MKSLITEQLSVVMAINHSAVVSLGAGPKQCCCALNIATLVRALFLLRIANWFHKLHDRFISLQWPSRWCFSFFLRFNKNRRWYCRERRTFRLIISSAILRGRSAIIAAALFIHFIWIFHLKLISKIVQLDYRSAVLFPHISIQIQIIISICRRGKKQKIDFSFVLDIVVKRSEFEFGVLRCFEVNNAIALRYDVNLILGWRF